MKLLRGLDERRIRVLLAAFFLALAIPSVVLIAQAYSQLKWEAFRRNQLLAEDIAARVDADLRAAMATEEARSFGDYAFLVVEGDAAANFVQRSPLSAFPVTSAIPGVLGYFQVDAGGKLTTPLLPEGGVDAASYGISADEQGARSNLVREISDVLAANKLVRPGGEERVRESVTVTAGRLDAPASNAAVEEEEAPRANAVAPEAFALRRAPESPEPTGVLTNAVATRALADAVAPAAVPPAAPVEPAQVGFDRLAAQSSARVQALVKDEEVPSDATEERVLREIVVDTRDAGGFGERQKRTEQGLVPEASVVPAAAADAIAEGSVAAAKLELRVRTFESELDPFEIGVLDTGHLVMFRNVWRDGQRYIQGALIDGERFAAQAVAAPFRASSLAGMSDLAARYQGRTLSALSAGAIDVYSSNGLAGSLLYRTRLSPPFGDLELVFGVNKLPRAPGSLLLGWVAVALAAVLCGGFFFMYRFALGQIRLGRQQQDFVSAVSHELKTPLTSIRMYGEMLKAGWADDAKKQTYYDYIHSESERLSRLIENVLQLARLTRNSQHFDMKRASVAELMDMVRSKVGTQVERAGFRLEIRNDAPADAEVLIDADSFAQIIINLVDNALKFSAGAQRKAVEIASRRESDGTLLFTVRDFGPGVPKGQMKKIFELFYRPENELTRETVGTGIGLALVHQLTTAMGGRVEVRNCEPGAEFRVSFAAA